MEGLFALIVATLVAALIVWSFFRKDEDGEMKVVSEYSSIKSAWSTKPEEGFWNHTKKWFAIVMVPLTWIVKVTFVVLVVIAWFNKIFK